MRNIVEIIPLKMTKRSRIQWLLSVLKELKNGGVSLESLIMGYRTCDLIINYSKCLGPLDRLCFYNVPIIISTDYEFREIFFRQFAPHPLREDSAGDSHEEALAPLDKAPSRLVGQRSGYAGGIACQRSIVQ